MSLKRLFERKSVKERLLVFDFNNLLHRSMFAYQGLSHEGTPTSGIFGFITLFCKQINDHNPSDVLVCTDTPPYARKELYPQYKSDRKPLEKDAFAALKINSEYCKTFLSALGVTLWGAKGLEADDLIAIICDEYSSRYNGIVIISNDDDMFQLFKYPNIKIQRGKNIYTKEDYQRDYPDINSKTWITISAMAGTHNGIPGIPRVGVKTAIKIINDPDKWTEITRNYGTEIDLFSRIVRLPFDDSLDPPEINKPDFSNMTIVRLMSNWGIKYQSNFIDAFNIIKK